MKMQQAVSFFFVRVHEFESAVASDSDGQIRTADTLSPVYSGKTCIVARFRDVNFRAAVNSKVSTRFPQPERIMKVRFVQTQTDLESLSAAWDRLAWDNFFCRFNWLASWWSFYGRGNQLLVIVVEDEQDNVVGIAPLYRTYSAKCGRSIRFLGSNNACSDYLRVLAGPTHLEAVSRLIATALMECAEQKKSSWDLLELAGVTADEPSVLKLCEALDAEGCTLHKSDLESAWKIELPESWETYHAQLGKSFRRTLKKLEKELVDTGKAQFFEATNQAEFDRGWAILLDLHQKRRESIGQPGCFVDARFGGFLKTAAQAALQAGALRLQWTELDGRPLAASIGFSEQHTISMYQTGLDPELIEFRPGHLHNLLVIKRAMESGARVVDFLRGNETYKALWRARPTTLQTLRIVPRRLVPQLRHRIWMTGRNVKAWLTPATAEKE